uniref:Uncharacterized protein n=1 Tax=Solanum lycopersicum TaxID=4081 RepID=A0A3Q7GMU9_SOLLC
MQCQQNQTGSNKMMFDSRTKCVLQAQKFKDEEQQHKVIIHLFVKGNGRRMWTMVVSLIEKGNILFTSCWKKV